MPAVAVLTQDGLPVAGQLAAVQHVAERAQAPRKTSMAGTAVLTAVAARRAFRGSPSRHQAPHPPAVVHADQFVPLPDIWIASCVDAVALPSTSGRLCSWNSP